MGNPERPEDTSWLESLPKRGTVYVLRLNTTTTACKDSVVTLLPNHEAKPRGKVKRKLPEDAKQATKAHEVTTPDCLVRLRLSETRLGLCLIFQFSRHHSPSHTQMCPYFLSVVCVCVAGAR